MADEENTTHELDRLVRQALDPDEAAIERTVDAALGPRRRPTWVPWTAAATVVVALTVIVVLRDAPRAPAPPAPTAPRVLVISNEGGAVSVTTPDGARFVVGRRG